MKEHASKAIERKVLSYLLEYPDSQHQYIPRLSVGDFYHHRDTFKLYTRLYKEDSLDSPTVFTRTDGEIADIMRTTVSPNEIESLYENLRDMTTRRQLNKLIPEIEGVIQSEDSVQGQISDLEQELTKITEGIYEESGLVGMETIAEELMTHLYELRKIDGEIGIPSGIGDLDRLTNGFEDGEYIMIAARPRIGKTDMMLQFALNSARKGYRTGIFTLEMLRNSLMKRVVAQMSGVNRQKIRRGTYNDRERDRLNSQFSRLTELPLLIDDKSRDIDEITYVMQREVRRNDLDIAFIDYLGLINVPGQYKDQRVKKEEASERLKFLAQDLSIPLVCLVQLNRNVEHRDDPTPRLSDLRQSGQLEQDADIILFIARPGLYKDDYEPDETVLKIGKQRNGPEGTLDLRYDMTTGVFNE